MPEGYFSSLEMRLSYIPSREQAAKEPRRSRLPVFSLAAACACAALFAFVFLTRRSPSGENVLEIYERYYYADLIPHTDPDMVFDMSEVCEECSAEDIEEFLIETGTSLYHIEQTLN